MRTTIKMIAERAGVSIGTVDRVLHDRPYVKVEVRERVLRVMEELDYHPNRMASALATSGTPRKLALVQPEWEEGFVRDEMDAGTARFLEEYRDYNVSLDIRNYPSGDEAECLRLLNEAVENGAQAVALCASGTEEIRRALERLSERGSRWRPSTPTCPADGESAMWARTAIGPDGWPVRSHPAS